MYNLDNHINHISNEFIEEAKNSPNLLLDMASMEKYLAESYSNRIFIEMLQNADDAKSKKFSIIKKGTTLQFMNDGRAFNEKDVRSICRSGASEKIRGENIGYRGVGFKSTLNLSNEIFVQSNGTVFCFSSQKTRKALGIKEEQNVPKIRIPFIVPENEYSNYDIESTNIDYNNTFYYRDVNQYILTSEIGNLNKNDFVFLKHIENIKINIDDFNFEIKIVRNGEKVSILTDIEKTEWKVIGHDFAKIAFYMNDNEIMESNINDNFYHAYLPTNEKCCYMIKINGDFSTDPSRKHITMDKMTTEILEKIAENIFNYIKNCIKNDVKNLGAIFNIFKFKKSFTPINDYLSTALEKLLKSKWIETKDYSIISPEDLYKKPIFLNDREWHIILRNESNAMGTSLNYSDEICSILYKYLDDFAMKQLTTEQWIELLSNESIIQDMPLDSLQKIYLNFIKEARNNNLLNEVEYNFNDLVIKDEQNIQKLIDIPDNIKYEFFNKIKNSLTQSECEWVEKNFKLSELTNNSSNHIEQLAVLKSSNKIDSNHNFVKPMYKWRNAEQHCILYEESLGNVARDVSKQNLGYDVISKDRYGNTRYIEVKFLKNKTSSFSITNNEYTTAHDLNDNYYLCLIYSKGDKLYFEYIQNPIKVLKFQKVVRQWEWICEEFSGDVTSFNLE